MEESTPIKVFDSLNSNISSSNNGNLCNAACNGSLPLNNNLPEVFVKAIANSLTANISRYFVPSPTPGVIPTTQLYRADVIIGLFTIIELYRLTTITVITTEPGEPPQCPPSYSNNDPCQEHFHSHMMILIHHIVVANIFYQLITYIRQDKKIST